MQGPANYPIAITRGDDFVDSPTAGDGAGGVYDLTGATITAAVWRVSQTTHAFTIVVTDAAAGAFTMSLPRSITVGMIPGDWRWEFTVTSADDVRQTLISGRFQVLESSVAYP